VTATSFPFTGCKPALVASQPFGGPGDDAVGNVVLVPAPLSGSGRGVVEAERRALKVVEVPIEMFGKAASERMADHQCRVQEAYNGLVAVFCLKLADPEAPHEAHLHGVGAPDGAEGARPDRHPVTPPYPEIRVEHLHAVDLRGDGWRCAHSGGSDPKWVCDGAAKDLLDDAPAMAGAASPDRTTSMRPDLGSW
jgi:hypothetical protein